MIEMSDVEARLGSLFDAVAHQVPDVPAAAWASRDEFENHDDDGRSPGPLDGDLEASSSSSRRQRRPRATAVVVVSGVLLVGTGVAAATGALSPSAIKQNAQHALTPAGSILGSPDPASVPGAVVRLSTPGPEGTVLQVTSDAGTYNDLAAASCVTITISEPNGSAAPGSQEADKGGCAVVGTSSLDDPLPVGDAVSAGETVTTWSSPSGQSYTIEFGEGPAGTAAVAFTDAQDDVGAKAVAVNGWYAVYIASGLYTSFDNLSFFNDAGQMIGLGH